MKKPKSIKKSKPSWMSKEIMKRMNYEQSLVSAILRYDKIISKMKKTKENELMLKRWAELKKELFIGVIQTIIGIVLLTALAPTLPNKKKAGVKKNVKR